MAYVQPILMYIIVALAVAYLVKKFFLPKRLFASKKAKQKSCGDHNCGCH